MYLLKKWVTLSHSLRMCERQASGTDMILAWKAFIYHWLPCWERSPVRSPDLLLHYGMLWIVNVREGGDFIEGIVAPGMLWIVNIPEGDFIEEIVAPGMLWIGNIPEGGDFIEGIVAPVWSCTAIMITSATNSCHHCSHCIDHRFSVHGSHRWVSTPVLSTLQLLQSPDSI